MTESPILELVPPSVQKVVKKTRAIRAKAERVKNRKHETENYGVMLHAEQAAAIEDCKALFMRYVPITRIAEVTGQPVDAISSAVYRKNGWKSQRDLMQAEINEAVKQDILGQLRKVAKTNLDLIEKGLFGFASMCQDTGLCPDLDQVEQLSKIFERLNKAKMTEDQAGLSKELQSLAPEEIIKAFAEDPYLRLAIAGTEIPKALPPAEEESQKLDLPPLADYEQSRFDSDIQRNTD